MQSVTHNSWNNDKYSGQSPTEKFTPPTPAIVHQARLNKQRGWAIPARIKSARAGTNGTIVNVTETGMHIKTKHPIHAREAEDIDIDIISMEMGIMTGKIIYIKGDDIAVDIRLNTNTSAQLRSILRGGG